MNMQYIYKTSNKYKIITFTCAVLFWTSFNLLTGLITGDMSLNDNYFLLLIVLSCSGFLSSYKVQFNNGHIFTYQFGMVTNSINLYEADKVLDEGKRLVIYYPNDSRFPIKINRFDDLAINVMKNSIKLHSGEKKPDSYVEQDVLIEKNTKPKEPKYNQKIVLGIVFLVVTIIAGFTNVIYFPSRNGSGFTTYLNESPVEFYILFGAFLISGLFMLINGLFEKFNRTMPNKKMN